LRGGGEQGQRRQRGEDMPTKAGEDGIRWVHGFLGFSVWLWLTITLRIGCG
jgi:hypothetical protein